jgi:hypothetical protein
VFDWFAERFDIALNEEVTAVHRRLTVGMDVHVLGARFGEDVDAAAEFVNGRLPEFFNGAGKRQMECRVPDDS